MKEKNTFLQLHHATTGELHIFQTHLITKIIPGKSFIKGSTGGSHPVTFIYLEGENPQHPFISVLTMGEIAELLRFSGARVLPIPDAKHIPTAQTVPVVLTTSRAKK